MGSLVQVIYFYIRKLEGVTEAHKFNLQINHIYSAG